MLVVGEMPWLDIYAHMQVNLSLKRQWFEPWIPALQAEVSLGQILNPMLLQMRACMNAEDMYWGAL